MSFTSFAVSWAHPRRSSGISTSWKSVWSFLNQLHVKTTSVNFSKYTISSKTKRFVNNRQSFLGLMMMMMMIASWKHNLVWADKYSAYPRILTSVIGSRNLWRTGSSMKDFFTFWNKVAELDCRGCFLLNRERHQVTSAWPQWSLTAKYISKFSETMSERCFLLLALNVFLWLSQYLLR